MNLQCDICDQAFNRQSSLTRHKKSLHAEGKGDHQCHDCSKVFSRQDILGRHQRTHRGEGLATCVVCSRAYRTDYLPKHTISCSRKEWHSFRRFPQPFYSPKNESRSSTKTDGLMVQWQEPKTSGCGQVTSKSIHRPIIHRRVEKPIRVAPGHPYSHFAAKDSLYKGIRYAINEDDLPLFLGHLAGLQELNITLKQVDMLSSISMLYQACRLGAIKIATYLLDQGVDIERQSYFVSTPLNQDCEDGQIDFVRILVEEGALVDINDELERKTALFQSVKTGNFDLDRLLLAAGAIANEPLQYYYRTPLLEACWSGRTNIAKLLLDAGASVDGSGTGYLLRPLEAACCGGSAETVGLLLEAGADVQLETVLELAIKYSPARVVEMLVQAGTMKALVPYWYLFELKQSMYGTRDNRKYGRKYGEAVEKLKILETAGVLPVVDLDRPDEFMIVSQLGPPQ